MTRKENPKIYTWTCQYCGEDFPTEHYSQRYCNRSCKNKAYQERKKQKT